MDQLARHPSTPDYARMHSEVSFSRQRTTPKAYEHPSDGAFSGAGPTMSRHTSARAESDEIMNHPSFTRNHSGIGGVSGFYGSPTMTRHHSGMMTHVSRESSLNNGLSLDRLGSASGFQRVDTPTDYDQGAMETPTFRLVVVCGVCEIQ